MGGDRNYSRRSGFTLIELSIVLVIIGLIVGGILVGQNLISAAAVRATITQIEKYNQAVNTFRGKYGYLPGDMPDPPASSFGFITPRVSGAGTGDGNGLIEGAGFPDFEGAGETTTFWVDLSSAQLIDGTFNTARETSFPYGSGVTATSTPNLNAFFPAAKMGNGNYVYVWNGSYTSASVGFNYFGLSALSIVWGGWIPTSTPALTVQQAYAMDTKIDDGMPQSGNVLALYLSFPINVECGSWAAGGGVEGAHVPEQGGCTSGHGPTTSATAGSATTCYDNSSSTTGTPGVAGAPQHYSLEISNGSNMNCALSFRLQ